MRDLTELDRFRVTLSDTVCRIMGIDPATTDPRTEGAFNIGAIHIIAASGGGWDHVSASLVDRCPTWTEMSAIHRLFFRDDEVAMQLHVPKADHINNHPFTLHLWRPHARLRRIPLPPKSMV